MTLDRCDGIELASGATAEKLAEPYWGAAERRFAWRDVVGTAAFYGGLVALLAFEAGVVHGIQVACSRLGHPSAGSWVAWAVFVVGESAWGALELKTVSPGRPRRDPVLRLCCWLLGRFGAIGYLLDATVVGGAAGTAVALRSQKNEHAWPLTLLAALLFSSVWVPVYVVSWP